MKRVSLDIVSVESPCDVPWASMEGDDRVRFCATCKQSVYRLSAMSREDAEQLIADSAGERLCVRFTRRADGSVVTTDCTPARTAALRRAARRSLVVAAAMVGAIAAVLGGAGWLFASEPLCSSARTAGDLSGRIADALAAKQPEYRDVQGEMGW